MENEPLCAKDFSVTEEEREALLRKAKNIKHRLGCGKDWDSPDAYFPHSGGKTSLCSAREVWHDAMKLANAVIRLTSKQKTEKNRDK